jgi:hypothetical protein
MWAELPEPWFVWLDGGEEAPLQLPRAATRRRRRRSKGGEGVQRQAEEKEAKGKGVGQKDERKGLDRGASEGVQARQGPICFP